MKKILSLALTLAMLLTMTAALAINASAVDGQWNVVYGAGDEEKSMLSGYEYTADGFHTIPTTGWGKSTPHLSIQTKDKVDLKEGVYLEIRVDNFTYQGDKWFDFHIWDSVGVAPGSADPANGHGIGTLIRPTTSEDVPGQITKVDTWYYDCFTTVKGYSPKFVDEQNKVTETNQPIMAMTLTWDGASFVLDINGAAAPAEVIEYMNTKWGGNDSEAYIGFNAMNSTTGGTAEVTVLKFGTSASDATTPLGDDSADPIDNTVPKAPIADPETVEAGQPAIFLTADKTNSDMKGTLSAANGGSSTINDDYSLHVVSGGGTITAANYTVKDEVSFDINDFPVAITLTKNFCTCGYEDGYCDAVETANYFICAGDVLVTTPGWNVKPLDMSYNTLDIGEDKYLYFFCDFSKVFEFEDDERINGLRFDVYETQVGDSFDLMFTAFFRTVEDAEAYVMNYLVEQGYDPEATTEEPSEATTEEPGEATTEKPGEATTEKPGEATTEKPGEATTEKPDDGKDDKGCGSVIGFGAITAVAAIATCGVVVFRKRKE